jgi:hypothetical protein
LWSKWSEYYVRAHLEVELPQESHPGAFTQEKFDCFFMQRSGRLTFYPEKKVKALNETAKTIIGRFIEITEKTLSKRPYKRFTNGRASKMMLKLIQQNSFLFVTTK